MATQTVIATQNGTTPQNEDSTTSAQIQSGENLIFGCIETLVVAVQKYYPYI